jgi:multisubunit Na+/H+ antiporter MnhC subunit
MYEHTFYLMQKLQLYINFYFGIGIPYKFLYEESLYSKIPALATLGLGFHVYVMVMGNPGLVRGPDLEVAVHNVAEPVTQPKTRLNTGRT